MVSLRWTVFVLLAKLRLLWQKIVVDEIETHILELTQGERKMQTGHIYGFLKLLL